MDTATSNKIDTNALELLEEIFGDIESIKLPINLDKIVDHCGLSVKQGQFADEELQGALDRQDATIYLSEDDSFEGKNFTLAHELGHYKLHEDIETDLFTMYQLKNILARRGEDLQEDQADEFAISLLMPQKLVRSLWEATNRDIESFSQIFGVPAVAAELRLRNLHLL